MNHAATALRSGPEQLARGLPADAVADRAIDPLLTAPILPTLVRFALPNMGAMLATALAAIAETTYVGRLGVARWPRWRSYSRW